MTTNELTAAEREGGSIFAPKYDAHGLICAVVCNAGSSEVLMVAYMNEEALQLTVDSGIAHFYSRSRQTLWKKGETSGNTLSVEEILVDCDQDALVLKVIPAGPTCHTGATSCFYRVLADGTLQPRSS
ncbi:MAG: phosphoribosyl-AMP cyclohydrolase [Sphingomonadaceae bacterium]|nr:phosphoribosyl-AMP cyclohydrolase [Sphingomonadaceae bacterium]MCP5391268.1 phosphoribosyl-AMP cyclohydrolase [Sphingomonadaceae bacterium]MCP5394055.1 phosphoribosyl-AMP cyclohydrolase [Sphingomonadaceae bacterium]